MVLNATFNNISVILWHLVLLVEETRVPGENHWQTLSHNVVSSTPCHEQGSNSQRKWCGDGQFSAETIVNLVANHSTI